jgi:hypothetical protein
MAAGPDLKQGATVTMPSGNVDFGATFLRLLGLAIPPSMQGRPLLEGLVEGSNGGSTVRTVEHTATTPDGTYAVTATFSILSSGGREYRYLDGTRVTRK